MDVLTPDKNFQASGPGPVRPAPCAVWMLFPLALLAAWAASAQPAVPTEYKVKAGCLFNFVQFVEWPAAAFEGEVPPAVPRIRFDP